MLVSLLCLLPLVSVETLPDGYLVRKELVILFLHVSSEKCFMFCVFSFPPSVYVGTFNQIALCPSLSILTFQDGRQIRDAINLPTSGKYVHKMHMHNPLNPTFIQ